MFRMLHLRVSTTGVRKISLSPKSDQIVQQIPAQLSPQSVKVMAISAKLRTRLLTALKSLPSPYTHFESHCSLSYNTILSQLSPKLIAAIRDFHSSLSAPGALLITGLPLDPILPWTPMNGERSVDKRSFVSEGCLTGISQLIGELFGYASEKDGEVIHNICPVRHRETVQSNESSKVDLSLHVENAYFDVRPDYLVLYCLRQDHKKEALTSLANIRSALSKMDPMDKTRLQKPVFVVPSPPSHHGAMGRENWSLPRPLFESPENPKAICHFPGMKALDPKAQKALDRFEKTLHHSNVTRHIALQPGNILVINNHRVAHGRTCFEPRYDGVDRWLQRVYIRASPLTQ